MAAPPPRNEALVVNAVCPTHGVAESQPSLRRGVGPEIVQSLGHLGSGVPRSPVRRERQGGYLASRQLDPASSPGSPDRATCCASGSNRSAEGRREAPQVVYLGLDDNQRRERNQVAYRIDHNFQDGGLGGYQELGSSATIQPGSHRG